MRTLKLLTPLIISLLSCLPAGAQHMQALLQHYSTDDGLPSNAISDIKQDAWGYLWLTTWNGLARFDGYTFKTYPTGAASGIPLLHNRIVGCQLDAEQNLWIRMYDDRVYVLIRRLDRIVPASVNPRKLESGNYESPKQADDKATAQPLSPAFGPQADRFKTPRPLLALSDGSVLAITVDYRLLSLRVSGDSVTARRIDTGPIKPKRLGEDHHGNIWIGHDRGLALLREGRLTDIRMLDGENISALDTHGRYPIAGTADGRVYMIDKGYTPVLLTDKADDITVVYLDSHGLVWFSDRTMGISYVDIATRRVRKFRQRVDVPKIDSEMFSVQEMLGTVWAMARRGGFGYYDRQTDSYEYFHNNPSNPWDLDNRISCFLATADGTVWESTTNRCLERLTLCRNTVERILPFKTEEGINNNDVRAMCWDDERQRLLVSTRTGLFASVTDGKTRPITSLTRGAQWRIYDIRKAKDGTFWIAVKGQGVIHAVPDGDDFTYEQYVTTVKPTHPLGRFTGRLASAEAYATVEDRHGNIWIATYGGGVSVLTKPRDGVRRLLNADDGIASYPKTDYRKVRTILLDRAGRLWAGTTDGLLILPATLRPGGKPLTGPSSVRDIITMAEDAGGDVWIGSISGGLSRTVGGGGAAIPRFTTYTYKEGMPSEEVRSIAFDLHGRTWFATDHNICSLDTATNVITTLGKADGVSDAACTETSVARLTDGTLLFGNANGIYRIDQNRLRGQLETKFNLRITDFLIDGRTVTPASHPDYPYYVPDAAKVRLARHGSVFAFRFASLNFRMQSRVHYKYMLEGYDLSWTDADRSRMAVYASVPQGSYRFVVKAYLQDAPGAFDTATIEVEVPPHPLLSSAAFVVYLLLLLTAGIVALVVVRRAKKRKDSMRVLKIGPQEIAFSEKKDYDFVKRQLDFLEQHYAEPNLRIEDMVAATPLSRTAYYNELKTLTQLSPKEFLLSFRIKKAMYMLRGSDRRVAEICYASGFNDPVYFSRIFRERCGMTPTAYRSAPDEPAAPEGNKSDGKPFTD